MELKRLSIKELQDAGKNIFYDYMSSSDEVYWYDFKFKKLSTDSETPAHQIHADYIQEINLNQARIEMYKKALKSTHIKNDKKGQIQKELEYLLKEHQILEKTNMKFQKELYVKTGSTDYCRTAVRIPLNKKINSFYDDLILEVIFYDDVCTLSGKFSDYCSLSTKEKRELFIKENTEITHMGLAYIKDGTHFYTSSLIGNLNIKDPRLQGSFTKLLPLEFSDFEHLTLSQISDNIDNNDLRQFFQSKIDLDKEKMIELATINIRGDIYKILKSPIKNDEYTENDMYIRYMCRSTGRIYYNKLDLSNLSISPEFKKDDYESYARAWWNINTLGSLTTGKPVIRL